MNRANTPAIVILFLAALLAFLVALLAFLALNVEIGGRKVETRSENLGVGRGFSPSGTPVDIGFWVDWSISVVGFVSQKVCETAECGSGGCVCGRHDGACLLL